MSTAKHQATKTYSDGHPLDAVHYREYKILLKPDHFTAAQHFKDFGKLLRHAAEELEVALFTDKLLSGQNQTREVVFYDTHKFDLYNQAFILRKRTLYENGFASGEPELALKFRHVDRDTAAAVDVRPDQGTYRVKFKEELLPLPDKIGGIRSLYSHNVVLAMSTPAMDPRRIGIITGPPLINRSSIASPLFSLPAASSDLGMAHGITENAMSYL